MKKKNEVVHLAGVFQEATMLSFSMAFFPIIFLAAGVLLDKNLGTMPLFTIIGVPVGIIAGILRALKLGKKIK